MDINELKIKADSLIDEAIGYLNLNGCYFPTLYTVSKEEEIIPVDLYDEKEEKIVDVQKVMELLADHCTAEIVIIDMNLMESDKLEDLPEVLKDDPRAVSALVCFLHTENESIMRQIRYKKDEESMTVNTLDWEETDEVSGLYNSPFTKNRKVSQEG